MRNPQGHRTDAEGFETNAFEGHVCRTAFPAAVSLGGPSQAAAFQAEHRVAAQLPMRLPGTFNIRCST